MLHAPAARTRDADIFRAQGRLTSPEEFEQMVVRETPETGIVRIGDVARVELGSQDYSVAGKGPKLAGTTRSDDFILDRIRNGKPGSMPAFAGVFSEGQIIAILAYIRTLEDDGQ